MMKINKQLVMLLFYEPHCWFENGAKKHLPNKNYYQNLLFYREVK